MNTLDQKTRDAIAQGYTFHEPAVQLGVLGHDEPVPDLGIRIPVSMFNRHGLVAGATGTGKTVTLQLMAEALSEAGVPVFAADIKGDLSGLATPGIANEKLLQRVAQQGQNWQPKSYPCEFYALGGKGPGTALRASVTSFGPILLSKVLGLNKVQESSLGLVFYYADAQGLPLLDLKDLTELLKYLISEEGKSELRSIGGISTATVGVILRNLITLAEQGGDVFFGEPEFDPTELLRLSPDGRGIISLLELPDLASRPDLFSTFLMWLLAELFEQLPEVGDVDRPKLVFFFDEAHLLFDDASEAFLEAITGTVRLIRSKGVGVFFVTQTPRDVPEDVLAQLGSRVQHQLRAHTPRAARALKATVETFPTSGYDLGEVLQGLGIGEAVVTVMDPDGAPTPVARTRLFAPASTMGPTAPEVLAQAVESSQLAARYSEPIDRESAYELLVARIEAQAAETQGHAEGEPSQQAPVERAPGKPSRKDTPGLLERLSKNTAVRQMLRTASREIVRGIFGTRKR